MEQQARDFFEEILKTKSLTVIHYKADDAVKELTGIPLTAVKAIQRSNSLDEIWAIAHEQLGQTEEAQKLRQWIEAKKKKGPKMSVDDILLDSHQGSRSK